MAYTPEMNEIIQKVSPYVRSFMAGYQNRIGQGSYYGGRTSDDTFVLGGQKITVSKDNEKDFLNLVWFVAKYVSKEIGKANKSEAKLDTLVAEVVYALKHGDLSPEENMRYVKAEDILNDQKYQEVRESFSRLEKQGKLIDSLSGSEIAGFNQAVSNGEYGSIKNEILYYQTEFLKDRSRVSPEKLKEVKVLQQKAIEIQNKIKQEAKAILTAGNEKLKSLKARQKELLEIMKSSDSESAEYKNAKEEAAQIVAENKELFDADSRYNKAVKELRELSGLSMFSEKENEISSQRQF